MRRTIAAHLHLNRRFTWWQSRYITTDEIPQWNSVLKPRRAPFRANYVTAQLKCDAIAIFVVVACLQATCSIDSLDAVNTCCRCKLEWQTFFRVDVIRTELGEQEWCNARLIHKKQRFNPPRIEFVFPIKLWPKLYHKPVEVPRKLINRTKRLCPMYCAAPSDPRAGFHLFTIRCQPNYKYQNCQVSLIIIIRMWTLSLWAILAVRCWFALWGLTS